MGWMGGSIETRTRAHLHTCSTAVPSQHPPSPALERGSDGDPSSTAVWGADMQRVGTGSTWSRSRPHGHTLFNTCPLLREAAPCTTRSLGPTAAARGAPSWVFRCGLTVDLHLRPRCVCPVLTSCWTGCTPVHGNQHEVGGVLIRRGSLLTRSLPMPPAAACPHARWPGGREPSRRSWGWDAAGVGVRHTWLFLTSRAPCHEHAYLVMQLHAMASAQCNVCPCHAVLCHAMPCRL